jgi:hypothetical protein
MKFSLSSGLHFSPFLWIPVPFLWIPVPFLQIPVPFLQESVGHGEVLDGCHLMRDRTVRYEAETEQPEKGYPEYLEYPTVELTMRSQPSNTHSHLSFKLAPLSLLLTPLPKPPALLNLCMTVKLISEIHGLYEFCPA